MRHSRQAETHTTDYAYQQQLLLLTGKIYAGMVADQTIPLYACVLVGLLLPLLRAMCTVKEVVTVIVAVLVFGDTFGLINGVGLVVVIGGVLLFNYYKLQKVRQQLRQRIYSKDGSIDLALDDQEEGQGERLQRVGSPRRHQYHHVVVDAGGAAVANGRGSISPDPGSTPGSFTRRKSGVAPIAPAGAAAAAVVSGGDEQELEEAELQALEFEPLLPINGIMSRR